MRYAPSPTGQMHLGGLRTALYNFLFARKHGGDYVLRLEDTDQSRKVEGASANFDRILEWAGIPYDEGPSKGGNYGPYVQSERLPLYHKHAHDLIEKGEAYRCFCTEERLDQLKRSSNIRGIPPLYDRFCLNLTPQEVQHKLMSGVPHTVRMKVPSGVTSFTDIVRGAVSFNNAFVNDQILVKSDGFPTYHLASVVDDHLMEISHVIRGEEWLASTPKHVMLYNQFGWDVPRFAHLPLLLNPDKSKMSKRQGDASVDHYIEREYLPESVVNFVAFIGWAPEDTQEIFTLEQLIEKFSLERVHKGGAIVNINKLDWFNGQHLRAKCTDDIDWVSARVRPVLEQALPSSASFPDAYLHQVIRLNKDRAQNFTDFVEPSRFFFEEADLASPEAQKARSTLWKPGQSETLVRALLDRLEKADVPMEHDPLLALVKEVCKEHGAGSKVLFHALRYLLTGGKEGPGVVDTMATLGRPRTLHRLRQAFSPAAPPS